jgi:hypothetical protein
MFAKSCISSVIISIAVMPVASYAEERFNMPTNNHRPSGRYSAQSGGGGGGGRDYSGVISGGAAALGVLDSLFSSHRSGGQRQQPQQVCNNRDGTLYHYGECTYEELHPHQSTFQERHPGASQCSNGGYCDPGNVCTSDGHCLAESDDRVCSDLKHVCRAGLACRNGDDGNECHDEAKEKRATERNECITEWNDVNSKIRDLQAQRNCNLTCSCWRSSVVLETSIVNVID